MHPAVALSRLPETLDHPVEPHADAQAALTVLGRLPHRRTITLTNPINLSNVHLTGARLDRANLTDASLDRADLTGATMARARLTANQANLASHANRAVFPAHLTWDPQQTRVRDATVEEAAVAESEYRRHYPWGF